MNFIQAANRTNRILGLGAVICTGILSGFLLSHSVMLGRFFTWIINSGNEVFFRDSFAPFREASRANVHYNMFMWVALVIGILWTISCFIVKKNRIAALTAGLSTFWVGSLFFGSGFAEAEDAVASGQADEITRNFFAGWNLPLHTLFACIYLVSFISLLIVCTRRKSS